MIKRRLVMQNSIFGKRNDRRVWPPLLIILPAAFFHNLSLGSPSIPDEKGLTTITTIGTLYSPVASVDWTSEKTSDISAHDRKIVVQAHEDALAFVASEEGIHGSMLEHAFDVLRAYGVEGTNIELAKMIAAELQIASE